MLTAWRWDFYSYWMEMRPAGGSYWGNDFINDSSFTVARDEWICVEMMIQLNSPVSERNGEQAMWINGEPWSAGGQLVSHLGPGFPNGNWVADSFIPDADGSPFEGFRWRSTTDLNINFVWLELYITTAPAGHVSRVWFDHLVVATEYIGPIQPASTLNPVTAFMADPVLDESATLHWDNPPDESFAGTIIRVGTGQYPAGPADGEPVCDRSGAPGTHDTFVHTGLSPNTALYYAAFAYSAAGQYAAPAQLLVNTRPARPENLRVIDK
jgi:hypothetical protein